MYFHRCRGRSLIIDKRNLEVPSRPSLNPPWSSISSLRYSPSPLPPLQIPGEIFNQTTVAAKRSILALDYVSILQSYGASPGPRVGRIIVHVPQQPSRANTLIHQLDAQKIITSTCGENSMWMIKAAASIMTGYLKRSGALAAKTLDATSHIGILMDAVSLVHWRIKSQKLERLYFMPHVLCMITATQLQRLLTLRRINVITWCVTWVGRVAMKSMIRIVDYARRHGSIGHSHTSFRMHMIGLN